MVIYQYDNSVHIFFIILFSLLLLIGIAVGVSTLPILKLFFQRSNPLKAKAILLAIIVVISVLSISLIILSAKNISQYYADIKEIKVDNCDVVTGKIEDLKKMPQYARGANITSYHLTFRIDDSKYYIDADVGVTLENVDFWNEGECITVYYLNTDEKNVVIRVVR